MSVSEIIRTAYSGLFAQSRRAEAIASNIANATTPGYQRQATQFVAGNGWAETAGWPQRDAMPAQDGERGSPEWPDSNTPDMAQELLDLMSTQVAWEANATAFETGADFWELLAVALGHERGPADTERSAR